MYSSEGVHDDSSLTMMDILEEQEAMQEDAEAVLGAGDDEHCTYDKGYMPRQAVYSCLTCNPVGGAGGRAGVCLACSIHCHNSHNLVELYTKRNFRCDCGNSKIIETKCKLTQTKDPTNVRNEYSQNYDGVYCVCHRPYPDPESPEDEDEMIQCCNCEDWFHAKHLGDCSAPDGDKYAEMICKDCIARLPFLQHYTALAVTAVSKNDVDVSVDVEVAADTSTDAPGGDKNKPDDNSTLETSTPDKKEETKHSVSDESKTAETGKQTKASNETSSNGNKDVSCAVTNGRHRGLPVRTAALFMLEGWRALLCGCEACVESYTALKVRHLVSKEDTISHYEQQSRRTLAESGRTSRERSVERELHALESVDRVTRTEMVTEYNTLSTELREYLRKFAETGKVVRDEDIKEFFAGLKARKKRKTMDGVPPAACNGL